MPGLAWVRGLAVLQNVKAESGAQGAYPKGGCRVAAQQIEILKITDCVDAMISNGLRYIAFTQNQPLKLSDD